MLRRLVVAGVLAGVITALATGQAQAHAGLRSSDPAAGSAFDEAPTTIRLTFLEAPEPALASIRVSGASGTSYATARPTPAPGDPLTLAVPVQLPDRRVYTVTWRVVSAVDGHAATGVFSFGVGVPAAELPAPAPARADLEVSPLELLGRWAFALGLIAVVGAATARLVRFGDSPGLARFGLAAASVGLVVLAEAQRRAGHSSFGDLLGTDVGAALAWRAVAVAVVAAGLLLMPGRPRLQAWVTGLAAGAAIAAHVSAGHASARGSLRAASVGAQWLHVAAVSVWAGGLAALLLSLRRGGVARPDVGRFSTMAAPAIAVLVATGVVRSFGGLSALGELVSTGYGRTISVKLILVGGIVALAAVNRRRGIANLQLLRRLAGGELALATGALGAAALLASLPPPAALKGVEPLGLTATGNDVATTVRVRLTTDFALPGPNRFVVKVSDYDTGRAIGPDRVSLRFTPLDDPSVPPSDLPLAPSPDRSFAGRGSNLSLEGRWGITAVIERGTESVSAPLEVQTKSPPQFLSVEAVPGQPVKYTVELVSGGGFLRVWADPPRAGPTRLYATFFDRFGEAQPVGDPVLTTGSGPAARQQTVRRLDGNRFVADVTLPAGKAAVAVVARTPDGAQRFRGAFTLDIPKR